MAFVSRVSAFSNRDRSPEDADTALRERDADALKRLNLVEGDLQYIQSMLARTDRATIEWFTDAFPDAALDYDRMLLIAMNNNPIDFLDWLVDVKKADPRRVIRVMSRLDTMLVVSASLVNMKWVVAKQYASVEPGMADEYFSRATMYKNPEEAVAILEWLDSLQLKPGSRALEFAVTYATDPYATVKWLVARGAKFGDEILKNAVRRVYQCGESAEQVEKLTVWLADTYNLEFRFEGYILQILEMYYMPETVPLLMWAIQKSVPRGEAVQRWIAANTPVMEHEYMTELNVAMLKILAESSP